MLYLELSSKHPFVQLYVDSTTGVAQDMNDVYIEIFHYEECASPTKVLDVLPTLMESSGTGEYYAFVYLDPLVFVEDTTYFVRISATDPDTDKIENSEQQFQVVPEGRVGKLNRQFFTTGDTRAFAIEFVDPITGAPKDMDDVEIEIVYYTQIAITPMVIVPGPATANYALAPTPMYRDDVGQYVYCLEIDGSFPDNTEFFVRYRATDPDTGNAVLAEEIFSSFESSPTPTLELYPVVPF